MHFLVADVTTDEGARIFAALEINESHGAGRRLNSPGEFIELHLACDRSVVKCIVQPVGDGCGKLSPL